MFSSTYQNGDTGVEIITTAGKGPNPRLVKATNLPKEYDRDIKGYKYILTPQASLQCPAASGRDTLGLLQPLLVFQLRCPHDDDILNLEIVVLDTDNQRRRFHISTTFRSLEPHSLHVQIPWIQTDKSQWTNVVFSLDTLVMHFFRTKFQSLDSFHLRPNCYLRKVFTLPAVSACRMDSSSGIDESTSPISSIVIPTAFEYPVGTTYSSFLFPSTTEAIKSALQLSKQQLTASEAPLSTVLGSVRGGGLGGGLVVAGQKIGSKPVPRHADSSPARRPPLQDTTPPQQLPKPPKTVASSNAMKTQNQHQHQHASVPTGRTTVGTLVASNLPPPNTGSVLAATNKELCIPAKRSVAVGSDGDVHVKEQSQMQSDEVTVEATSASTGAQPIDQIANKILAALLPDSAPRPLSTHAAVAAVSPPLPSPDVLTSSSLHDSNNSCEEHSLRVEALSMTPHIPPGVVSSSQSSQPPLPPSSTEEQLDRRLASSLSLSLSSPSSLPLQGAVAATTSTAHPTPPVAGISVGSFDDSVECFSLGSPSHNRNATDKENDELADWVLQESEEAVVVPLQVLRSRLSEIEYVLTQEERAFAAEFGSEELTKI